MQKYSHPSSLYLVDAPLASISLAHLDTATLLHSSLLKPCQVAQWSGENSPFQVQPQILSWIEV